MKISIEIVLDKGEDIYFRVQVEGESLPAQRFSSDELPYEITLDLLEMLGVGTSV